MDAIAFLKAFHPDGPWVLTAIAVDGKGIETRTFGPDTDEAARQYIDRYNCERNLYFSVNVPNCQLSRKATREDIGLVPYLHVDIDPRAGEPLDKERERIKRVVTTELNDGIPKPTFIVDSGGGYQLFWRLEAPVVVNDLREAAKMARYNKQLELDFGGDSCHNIDRIMRLPGTLNIPNTKKVQLGRRPAVAGVCDYEPKNVYPLTRFTPAPAELGIEVNTPVMVDLSKVERLGDVDELDKWDVPDRVKVIIVQGEEPNNPKEVDDSRSAWLFDVCCQLVRARVPDEVIFSIITDSNFAISASVLEKVSGAKKYAVRQIQRAHEEVEDPVLLEMNDKHCVVLDFGGKTRIVSEKQDNALQRRAACVQAKTDFLDRYVNKPLMINKKWVDRGQWWFRHPMRREAESLVYLPGEDAPGDLNLWKGFAVTSRAGNKHESYLGHLRENICSGVEEHYSYLIGWMARAVQKPTLIGEVAIVLRGGRGVGKSFFAKHFGHLWGQHFVHVHSSKHLVGEFNAHLRDCSVLFADEAFWAGDKKHEGTLKALVTEEEIVIEQKGVDARPARNLIHLIMASNEDWIVPAGAHERRFFVLDVATTRQQDHAYFGGIASNLHGGGYENLLHFLLGYDLIGFEVRDVPWTDALTDQVRKGQSMALWLVGQALARGEVPVPRRDEHDNMLVTAWDFVPETMREHDPDKARALNMSIGWVLRRINVNDPRHDRDLKRDGRRAHRLPPPAKAIERWRKAFGPPPEDWTEEVTTWRSPPF